MNVEHRDVAVVGAGPYGLAIAAACAAAGRTAVVFGPLLETWKEMPEEMELRAAWREMALTPARESGSLEEWCAESGAIPHEPMTVSEFISYATWFCNRYVPDHVADRVGSVEPTGNGFRVHAGSEAWDVAELVVAPGIGPFRYMPEAFAGAVQRGPVEFAADFSGCESTQRVAVIGAGQSAVEAAAAAARSGADTTLLARSPVHWFADHEPSHPRSGLAQLFYRLAYPAVGYGPPPLNRLVLHPDLFARLPERHRRRLTGRLLRPGASPWLRAGVIGKVRIEEGVEVIAVDCGEAEARLTLADGRQLEFDRVLLGTGYRFRLDRLDFLSPDLRSRIEIRGGWPVLDRAFRTTDPRIRLVGFPAEGRFGPIARFVLGVPFTAARVAATLPDG